MPRKLLSAQDWAEKYEDVLVKLVEDGLASYSVGGQTFTKQNITFYQEQYLYWKGKADQAATGSGGISLVNQGGCHG